MRERLGSPVDVPRVQTALRKLEGAPLSLVGRVGHAEPRIEDDMLRAWIKELETSGADDGLFVRLNAPEMD
ncbi:hypothetical protein [Thiofaba sp. EF100]|uniref:hypothetical protein n=1 Tax=Thiofaba sp. EF100 TaxID=3121274 RepID=UPI003221C292